MSYDLSICTYVVLAENLVDHSFGPLNAFRRSGNAKRLLSVEVGGLLDDHDLSPGGFLKD